MTASDEPTAELDALRAANLAFAARYPGDRGQRQPVHTVYGGAHLFRADTTRRLGAIALGSIGRFDEGRHHALQALAIASEVAAGWRHADAHDVLAIVEIAADRPLAALNAIDEALIVLGDIDHPMLRYQLAEHRTWALAMLGRAQAARLLARFVRDAAPALDALFRPVFQTALAALRLHGHDARCAQFGRFLHRPFEAFELNQGKVERGLRRRFPGFKFFQNGELHDVLPRHFHFREPDPPVV